VLVSGAVLLREARLCHVRAPHLAHAEVRGNPRDGPCLEPSELPVRILVVDDDAVLAEEVQFGLAARGSTLEIATNCDDGRAAIGSGEFDAVVLDVNLPDGSGLELLAELRASGDRTPILLLTTRGSVDDRVNGLDAGADDYLAKPFKLDELAARLRAISRRRDGRASPFLTHNGLTLDAAQMLVSVEGTARALSRREAAVLGELMRRPGAVVSRRDLEARLYGWQAGVESNTIEVHVHNLRTKVGRSRIETVRGLGYRMRPAGV